MRGIASILISALLVGASAIAVADPGGDDVRAYRLASPAVPPDPTPMAFASDGTGFAVINRLNGATSVLDLLRTTDGGSTWALWDSTSVTAAGGAAIVVVPGTPDRLVVSYYGTFFPIPGRSVIVTDVDGDAPVWTQPFFAVGAIGPSAMTSRVVSGANHVVLLYLDIGQLFATASLDGGSTFVSPTMVNSSISPSSVFDVALDEADTIHVALAMPSVGYHAIGYIRGVRSAGLVTWSAIDTIGVVHHALTTPGISVIASPVDDRVLIAVDERDAPTWPDRLRVFGSANRGTTWVELPEDFEDHTSPDLAWGDTGPAIAAVDVTGAVALIRPDGALLGPWTSEPMLTSRSPSPLSPDPTIASDPSHGDEYGVFAWRFEAGAYEGWFDAEWRDAPGYGIQDKVLHLITDTINSAPAIADLEGDGGADIVFTSSAGELFRYDGLTDLFLATGGLGVTGPCSAPALIDLDADGVMEIIVGNENGYVGVWDAYGVPVAGWPRDLGTSSPAFVTAGLIAPPGPQIVVASARKIFVLNPDGSLRNGFPYTNNFSAGGVVGRAAIGDVDLDGELEIVAAYNDWVITLDASGAPEETLHVGLQASVGVSMTDIDNDGDLEVAIPMTNGTVKLVHHDGTSVGGAWPFNIGPSSRLGPVAFADVNGGGPPELTFGARLGKHYTVTLSGQLPAGWEASGPERLLSDPEPIIGDIGEPGVQVVSGDEAGIGHAWLLPSGYQEGWPRDFLEPITVAQATGNVDNDPNVELAVAAGTSLWVLDMGAPESSAPGARWPMAGHDAGRTGCGSCPMFTSGVAEKAPVVPALHFPGAAPNPARHYTVIRFELPQPEVVQLRIFDAQGRLVRELLGTESGHQVAGSHSVAWNGHDDAGNRLAGGMYFARLTAGTSSLVRKVVLTP